MNIKSLSNGEVALVFQVKPGQKKEGIVVSEDGGLVLRINAQAQEGKANKRVVEFLAQILGCAKRDIIVARGELSRHKEIRIKNASVDEVRNALIVFINSEGGKKA